MQVGDLLQSKQENLSHLVGVCLGEYTDIRINVLWSDGMKTVELKDAFFVVSEKSSFVEKIEHES